MHKYPPSEYGFYIALQFFYCFNRLGDISISTLRGAPGKGKEKLVEREQRVGREWVGKEVRAKDKGRKGRGEGKA